MLRRFDFSLTTLFDRYRWANYTVGNGKPVEYTEINGIQQSE